MYKRSFQIVRPRPCVTFCNVLEEQARKETSRNRQQSLLSVQFHPKDGGDTFFRNVGLSPNFAALQCRILQHTEFILFKIISSWLNPVIPVVLLTHFFSGHCSVLVSHFPLSLALPEKCFCSVIGRRNIQLSQRKRIPSTVRTVFNYELDSCLDTLVRQPQVVARCNVCKTNNNC
jgi:hypothetical protein